MEKEKEKATKKKFLVALPEFPGATGFCHPTILVGAKDKNDAISVVKSLHPYSNIGSIKEVDY